MVPDERRHVVRLDDKDVMMIERALRGLHKVLGIQTETAPSTAQSSFEAERIAHTSALIQEHMTCDCGIRVPQPEPRRIVPLEDRPIIRGGS